MASCPPWVWVGSQGNCTDWVRVSISGSTGVATRGAVTQDPLAEAGSPWAENRSLLLSRVWSEGGLLGPQKEEPRDCTGNFFPALSPSTHR